MAAGAGAGGGGGGGGCHEPATEGAGAVVELKASCFSPTVVRVSEGTTVSFENRDDLGHVVLGTGWGSAETLAAEGVATYRFDSSGTYPYSCYLHPSMNGAVVVGDGQGSGEVTEVASAAPTPVVLAGADQGPTPRDSAAAAVVGIGIGGVVFGLALGWFWPRRRARRDRP